MNTLFPEVTAALQALEAARESLVALQTRLEAAQTAREAAETARQDAEIRAAQLEGECDKHRRHSGNLAQQIADQQQRNADLHQQISALHWDLRAENVPSLILKVAMQLTGADNGLFVDASGENALADVGLENLPAEVRNALYEFTRQSLAQDSPVVRNDGENLPDGSGLVNLAALPVAVHGDARGAILVANKRSGPFTDEDTEVLLSVGRHAGIALENRRLHAALGDAYVSTVAVLADAIQVKDPYTRGHCESVARIAVEVAKRLGLQGDELENVRYAALLHDVGKIGVPDGILLKPGRLLPEELQIIQRHAAIGSDLVLRVPSLSPIAPIILHHHERVDGHGYPDGLSGEEIALTARIIGVVDAFDAMTTVRPYRVAIAPAQALEELQRCAGKQFDAAVVQVLTQLLDEQKLLNS